MRSSALSDIGLVRTRNEDAYWCDPGRGIFIVADGVGGFQAGEVASALAIEIVSERLCRAVDLGLSDSLLAEEMHESFRVASQLIFERAQESEELRGMSCSLLATVVEEEHCLVAHAGDSRVYLFFDGALHQVTVDDTPVAAMVKRGYLLPEKALGHSMKNFLLKSVGNKPVVEANLARFPIKGNERLLLCSDGLWSMLDHETIRSILIQNSEPDAICEELIRNAREKGGPDNITVIVVDLTRDSDALLTEDRTEEMLPPG